MEESACNIVLRLPELLELVMWQLKDDEETLQSALRVNKAWAREAIDVLWDKPSVARLSAFDGDDESLQFYCRLVRELEIEEYDDETGPDYTRLQDLNFPRLNRFRVSDCRSPPYEGDRILVGQFIRPALEEFAFYGNEPPEDIFDLLGTRCPRLKSISICFRSRTQQILISRGLKDFLENCKSLKSIRLPAGITDEFVDYDLFECIALYDGLEELSLDQLLDCTKLNKLIEETEESSQTLQSFNNLRFLSIDIFSTAVPQLVTLIKSVTSLSLTVRNDGICPLLYVSSLVNLQELNIRYTDSAQEVVWQSTHFRTLSKLKNLRKLMIRTGSITIDCPTLTDADFISIFVDMKELQKLAFIVNCNLSETAITSLGKHCPQLISLHISGIYDLHCWRNVASPIFPKLQHLTLGKVVDSTYEGEEE